MSFLLVSGINVSLKVYKAQILAHYRDSG